MQYRSEIDGLRTIAVVPVILFHAGVPYLDGGFIGVDVFFVISGFLITSILINDLEAGRYSLLKFYERRARRILPALVVVVLACLPFAWAWMLADQLRDFGQSIVATSLFASNILFWIESGYFDFGNYTKPLIHTWSLAIEEQFYILFPPLLALAWRFFRSGVFWMCLGIGLVSLGIAQYWSFAAPDAGFFLLPSRAWELMAGALAAFWMHRRPPNSNGLLALLGAICLAGSFVLFNKQVPHPSLWTLFPVVGTVLILVFARADTRVGQALSLKPFVAIGLVSYSAYLWHQPLFVFARVRSIGDPSLALMLSLAVLSLILAALSWKFVEAPFRSGHGTQPRLLAGRTPLLATSGLVLSAMMGVGLVLFLIDGAPGRVPAVVMELADAAKDRNPNRGRCLQMAETPDGYVLPPASDCATKGDRNRPLAVILGDSHADAIAAPMRTMLEDDGWRVTQMTASDCAPAAGLHLGSKDCHDVLLKNLIYIEKNSPALILTVARFQNVFTDDFFDNGEGGKEYEWNRPLRRFDVAQIDNAIFSKNVTPAAASVSDAYARLAATGAVIVIVYPIPEAGWRVPERAAKKAFFDNDPTPSVTTDRTAYERRAQAAISVLDALDKPNILRIRPAELLCDDTRCLNARDGEIYYYDDDHLSLTGAQLIADKLDTLLAENSLLGPSRAISGNDTE